jgi:hypothetical protein
MIPWLLQKIFGTKHEREIKTMRPKIAAINDLEPKMRALSDEDLRGLTFKYKERIDNGEAWRADLDFVARGVELGIPVDIQEAIARAWLRFLKDHELTVIHTEHNVVNDALKVAGTLDRIVEWQGRRVVLDIKTGSKVDKTAYAVQLARYAGSVPYDVDTDERGTW